MVLRTKEAKRLGIQPDEVGSNDTIADAFFTERDIPAARLQAWDGRQWTRLTENAIRAMTPKGYARPDDRPLDWSEGDGANDDEGYYIDENALYPKAGSTMGQAKTASGDLPTVGGKWDRLGLPHMRIGWLKTQSHRHPDIDFGLPWAGLGDDQKGRISALAAEASQPGFSHKKAVQIRKSSGSQEDALNKVVRILGTGGVGTLVVEGIAVQEHGHPRNTVDIDLSVSDSVKARQILARNGYRMGNGIVVLDPEYDEEIDILQGGQPAIAGGVPMPMPQETNTKPKVCDLEDLINLKIGSFLGAESVGLVIKRLKDRDDVYTLMSNNQLPQDFLKGKTYEKEYAHMWDVLHAPPHKVSHEDALEKLANLDNDGLIAFHKARKAWILTAAGPEIAEAGDGDRALGEEEG